MKNLKTYRMFESVMELTQEQIEWLDKCVDGSWKLNPQTGLIDVDGDFDCSSESLTDLKGIKFGEVSGVFYCRNNRLTSLEGAPQSVDGMFSCSNNQLTSLEGAPQTVRIFYCNDNPVSEETLASIFALMKKGKSYQQALEEHWPKMNSDDRALMYKQMPNLPPEETRKYQALAKYNNIKGYL